MDDNTLRRTTPEAAGVSPAAVLNFLDRIEAEIDELHSFMLVRHGQVYAEGWWHPYTPQRPHWLYSLSKSFTSTAVGIAVEEGCLSLDDKVLDFFPEEAPAAPDENLRAMRVRHLLMMGTGHDQDPTVQVFSSHNWVKTFLSLPVEHAPGTHFCYNTAATYMLSAIVQKLTGQTLVEYLTPRLFEPLGITGAKWQSCPLGINVGGSGLSIKTEDIARFGLLYLNKGVWTFAGAPRRLLTEEWVAEATAKQIENGTDSASDWNQGYGYQFWRCRHNAYRGDGAFGQFCVVLPEKDAVIAITSGTDDMQGVLNIIWETLLPAMGPEPLPADPAASERLAQRLPALAVKAPEGEVQPPADPAKIDGRRYQIAENPLGVRSMAFSFDEGGCTLEIDHQRGLDRIPCGYAEWRAGKTAVMDPHETLETASAARWQAENRLVLTVRLVETPYIRTLACDFDGDRLAVATVWNVSFGPLKGPNLEGSLIPE